jgi:DNA-binding transcriptional ArsR family regulator
MGSLDESFPLWMLFHFWDRFCSGQDCILSTASTPIDEPKKEDNIYSSGELIRPSILWLLLRKTELTAKDIQEALGLKRQTTYNYLKELEDKGWVKVEYRQHESKPHMNVGYYSRVKKKAKKGYGKKKKQWIYSADRYLENLSADADSTDPDCEYCDGNVKNAIIEKINFGIAALSEKKKFLQGMSDAKLKSFLETNKHFPGPSLDVLLLTNDEFADFGQRMKALYADTLERWLVEHKDQHDENFVVVGFFKE